MKKYKNYALVLAVLLILVISVLWVSSNATANSSLYTTRLNITEKILAIRYSGDFQKANYALDLAQKRLLDLQALKESKSLESAAGILARDNFNQQTIIAQQNIMALSQKEGVSATSVLTLTEGLDVVIEGAKAVFNIDQLEILDEGAPIPKATSTKVKSK